MTTKDRLEDLSQQALEKWGDDTQSLKAVEELIELALNLLHYRYDKVDRDDVLSELADVTIMSNQLMLTFDISKDELEEMVNVKLDKLEKTLSN